MIVGQPPKRGAVVLPQGVFNIYIFIQTCLRVIPAFPPVRIRLGGRGNDLEIIYRYGEKYCPAKISFVIIYIIYDDIYI
jgi:hypothetical protein